MGPQGTLFGKNATSGVISIATVKPVIGELSAKANVSYGLREDRNATLTINAPLGDKAALRVSAFSQGQEGYGDYTTLHQPLNSFKEYGYRAKLLLKPSTAWRCCTPTTTSTIGITSSAPRCRAATPRSRPCRSPTA
jgi:iron complex outermembrane receptor protein